VWALATYTVTFMSARQQMHEHQAGIALFNLLEEVAIRRTRPFIRKAYPNATILGKPSMA